MRGFMMLEETFVSTFGRWRNTIAWSFSSLMMEKFHFLYVCISARIIDLFMYNKSKLSRCAWKHKCSSNGIHVLILLFC